MQDFQLCSSAGRSVLLSDYREHTNMMLVFNSESRLSMELLSELEGHRPDLAERETSVPVIVPGSQLPANLERALNPGLEILVDLDGRLHRSMGANYTVGHIIPALFITDRFGGLSHTRAHRAKGCLTSRQQSAGFTSINRQSPECGPLECLDKYSCALIERRRTKR